ncbi:MAG: Serine/threonine-protein kinase pkn1 [Candidatus Hydrogenedentes bacterium ADurb.Bin101]|nr:MAG: Serine/threonine-protein kinase pkn1 [Candidatus Hydrogenedentes bacterium ADurb.Bin101]
MSPESVFWTKGCAMLVGLVVVMLLGAVTARAEVAQWEVPFLGHPADANENWRLVMGEAIAYLAGWQQGDNPIGYAIRAAYLWQNGEWYAYNSAQEPPVCWELAEPEEGEGEIPVEGEYQNPTETLLLPDNVPLELVRIPARSFQMGSPDTERSRHDQEGPVHKVTIDYDFYMGKYEVTQAQWLAVMSSWPGTAPSSDYGLGDDYPAYWVSWDDAQNFITALNIHITNTGQGPATMRLPSEAEWEYACRAGTQTRFYFDDSLSVDDYCEYDGIRRQYMWYCGNNYPTGSKPVGGKLFNAFGLYDMSGNVHEWCQDWYHSSYTGAPADGSAWESPVGSDRVRRGGCWYSDAGPCRSASRWGNSPYSRGSYLGFRLAASPAVR